MCTENGQNAQDTGTPPFVDTPVKAAKRQAFDSPTEANLDALIDAVRMESREWRDEAPGSALRAEVEQACAAERAAMAVARDLEAARQELRDELVTARRLRDEAIAERDQQAGALVTLRAALENVVEHVCDSDCDLGCCWVEKAQAALAASAPASTPEEG
jgi:hypothetical protein